MSGREQPKKQKETTLWSLPFVLVILINLANGVVGMMTVPLVTEYALSLGAELTLASAIAGLMSLTSLFICPIAGVVSDRMNRKKLLIIADAGYGLFLIMHAFAAGPGALIILRLLTGICFSFISVASIAFSTAFIPQERMGEGLGYAALASIIAQAAGPALGIGLSDRYGHGVAFAAAGIIAFLCMAVLILLPYNESNKPAANKKTLQFKDIFAVEFAGFMCVAALFSAGNGLVSTYLKTIANERSIVNISLFFTLYSICMVIIKPITGRLLDKKGPYFILFPSVVFAALGMMVIGISYSLGLMLVAAVFKALGQGNGTPSLQATAVKKLDKSRAGVATSTIQIGQNIGNAVAPILGSFVVKASGYETAFIGSGAIILVFGMLLVLNRWRKDRMNLKE